MIFKKIIILALLLTSCATKKVKDTETEIQVDSSTTISLDATKFSESYTLEPIDLDRPILVGGKEYLNTKVIYNNSKERIIYKDSTKKKVDLKQDIREKEKDYTQAIESVTNRLFWLIIIIVVILLVFSFIKKKLSI